MKLQKKTYSKLILFAVISSIIIILLPAINYFFYFKPRVGSNKPLTKEFFTLDNIEASKNKWLLAHHLSGNMKEVIVGKDNQLYLGNKYQQILQKYNNTYSLSLSEFDRLISQLYDFQSFLIQREIPFLLSLVPEKHGIYPQDLPIWYHSQKNQYRSLFLKALSERGINYLDMTPILRQEDRAIYYKRDTHWNRLGGQLGYQAAMNTLDPDLLTFADLQVSAKEIMLNGDLYRLLKFNAEELESDYDWDLYLPQEMIKKCRFNTKRFVVNNSCEEVRNTPTIINQYSYVTYNKNALNDKRLLWIRDSFGNANSILFQGTFSETVQIHYYKVTGERLYELVKQVKPDYVLYQVVERNIENIN